MKEAKNFAIIGAAGYIAQKHVSAIKESNNNLVAAMDINANAGYIDNYFPHAAYLTDFAEFDRFLTDYKKLDYLVVCSPNYMHYTHVLYGMRNRYNIICEKPITTSTYSLNELIEAQKLSNSKVNTIMQLRYHPDIVKLKNNLPDFANVKINYVTSRGSWYYKSWKLDERKSGGLLYNIGIHMFDLMTYLFGEVLYTERSDVHKDCASGQIALENAKVQYYLSIYGDTEKKMTIDGNTIDLTYTQDLHLKSYQEILNGNGFTLNDATPSIELINSLTTEHVTV